MFTLMVKTDTAAFEDPGELGRIMREVANRVRYVEGELSGVARDINGNTVGHWTLTTED